MADADRKSVLASADLDVLVPRPPNFLRVRGTSNHMIAIEDLDDRSLERIGESWTNELLALAERKRNAT